MMVHLVIAAFVLLGTGIQMLLSLRDVARSYKPALQHKVAEDELISELPLPQRYRARRNLIRDRDPSTHAAIREAFAHVAAWGLLFGAAATATFDAIAG